MPKLSPARAGVPLLPGLELLSRGKVRDTYVISGEFLLSAATNGVSIFDHILNALVPEKGRILNALSCFWDQELTKFGIKTHLVAAGSKIDDYIPKELRGDVDLQSRAMVIRRLDMAPVEFIARGVLTGSSVKEYKKSGTVCGQWLPPGLQDGDELPCILDTPTSKAEEGHDKNLLASEIRARYPQQTYALIQAFQIVSAYARKRGILLADTKLEFGEDGTLADELFTPDSSRYWEYAAWLKSRESKENRKPPAPFDKQFVRAWGITQGIRELDPENPEHVAQVHAMAVPPEIIRQTTLIYRYIFWRLTGETIENYLRNEMGVAVQPAKRKVAVVLGSESDLPQAKQAIGLARVHHSCEVVVHILSCHRNPKELRSFVESVCMGADVLVCAGSKAFAQPGVLDAEIQAAGKSIRVIGVALGEPGSEELLAAQLSIKQLPGKPVVMDEISGKVYTGPEGLYLAIERAATGELPPPPQREKRLARFNVW